MHLDRQVHDINCSFTPGLSGPEAGESGCGVTMVSAYSSVLREVVWGGIPISLPGMAVFAFLLALCAEILLSQRYHDRRAMGFLALATGVPLLTSIVMGTISIVSLGAVCKICVGIYFSSAVVALGGVAGWWLARKNDGAVSSPRRQRPAPRPVKANPNDREHDPAWLRGGEPVSATEPVETRAETAKPLPRPLAVAPIGTRYLAIAFAIGVLFVTVPAISYVVAAPDHSNYIGTCGGLEHTEIDDAISLSMGDTGSIPALEVLDPLCPVCKQFESRLHQIGYNSKLSRRAVLFPLDTECNWMLDKSPHPGACAISEAMLCAGSDSQQVLAWAFEEQAQIIAATKADPAAAARMVTAQFPALASCVGKTEVRAKLNRGLRWAVDNQLQVLTPQLFVAGVKLCDEDVDLGLKFALSRMVERHQAGTLKAVDINVPAEQVQ